MKSMAKKIGLLLLPALLLVGCTRPKEPITRTAFHLNTVVTVTIYDSEDENLLDECMALCEKYEAEFSRTREDSLLYQLNEAAKLPENAGKPLPLSPDLYALVEKGLEYSRLSDGGFDLTVEPLTSLWDFTAENPQVPAEDSISSALSLVDYRSVHLQDSSVTFARAGMGLDPGAIAKGYIADRIKDYLLSQGVKSAYINLGGNSLVIGSKPDGSPFRIGIQKPFSSQGELSTALEVRDYSVVTSGVYERCFEQDGHFYHHLLDPKTGYPYENHLLSVTIVSPLSVDGDALSTACFSLGLEKGMALLNQMDGIYGLFITDDQELHFSDGFSEAFPSVK